MADRELYVYVIYVHSMDKNNVFHPDDFSFLAQSTPPPPRSSSYGGTRRNFKTPSRWGVCWLFNLHSTGIEWFLHAPYPHTCTHSIYFHRCPFTEKTNLFCCVRNFVKIRGEYPSVYICRKSTADISMGGVSIHIRIRHWTKPPVRIYRFKMYTGYIVPAKLLE